MQISVTITGGKELQSKMKRIGRSFNDLTPAFKNIGDKAVDYFQGPGYLSQGTVFGAAWALLNRSYALRKAKRFPGRPPLVASGKMISGYRYDASATSVIIGNRMPYFKFHQSTKPRTKIPRRATMGINDPIKQMVQTEISDYIGKQLRIA